MKNISKLLSGLALFSVLLTLIPFGISSPVFAEDTLLLSDTFEGTAIDTSKWTVIDPFGGQIQVGYGITVIANSYANGYWGQTALVSNSGFDRDGLSLSAQITPSGSTLLGYGDYNFQQETSQAYMLNISNGSLSFMAWKDGDTVFSQACGAASSQFTYGLKLTSTGVDVFVNGGAGDVTVCSVATPGMETLTNQKMFLQAEIAWSVFDNVQVRGGEIAEPEPDPDPVPPPPPPNPTPPPSPPPAPNPSGVLLHDTFSTNTIDTTKWTINDTSGYLVVSAWDVLGIGNSYNPYSNQWNQTSLVSKQAFAREDLDVSARITRNSDTLLGYGDSNFQSAGTAAYMIDVIYGQLIAAGWQDGQVIYFTSCGGVVQGADYTMQMTPTGMEVLVGQSVQCTVEMPLMATMTDKPVFIQAAGSMSYIDEVKVTGATEPPAPAVPGKPVSLAAVAGDGQIEISWSAPTAPSNPAVTDYIVEYKLQSDSVYSTFADEVSSSVVTATVSGLINGSAYDFRVSAVNTVGQGLPSDVVTSTPEQPSELVTLLSDSFDGAVLSSAWSENDPSGYHVVMTGSQLAIAHSYSTATGQWNQSSVTSKESFPKEELSVAARLHVGSDTLIGYGDSNFQTPGTQAYVVDVTPGYVLAGGWHNGQMHYVKDCGSVVQGASYILRPTLTGFDTFMDAGSGEVLKCSLDAPLMTDIDDKPIFFQTAYGTSYIEEVSVNGMDEQEVPQAATGTTILAGQGKVTLAWQVELEADFPATAYDVDYKLSESEVWEAAEYTEINPTKVTINGLTNGLSYDFRVVAKNQKGRGEPSEVMTVTPDEPSNLTFVITGESNSGGIGANAYASPSEMAVRPSVQIMNLTSGLFQFEDLQFGVNNLRDHQGLEGYYATAHGLELALANAVDEGDLPGISQVNLIKTGQGGSTVSAWDAAGANWGKFLERISFAKAQLPQQRKWVVWYSLGLNDARFAYTPLADFEAQTRAHIAKIKAELPGAAIVMTGFESMGDGPYTDVLKHIVETDAALSIVDTTGAQRDDPYHWSYLGLLTVGGRMAEATVEMLGLTSE